MFLKNTLPRVLVNETFSNKKENFDNNESNDLLDQLNLYASNQRQVDLVSTIVWVISLILVLTLGVWLWNNVLVQLFPFINKTKNPLQLLGLVVLINMIF